MKKYYVFLSKAHNLFLVIALPAILLFIFSLPPSWGLDEQVHTARAYQISEGNLYPDQQTSGGYGGQLPVSLVDILNYGHLESNTVDRNAPFFDRRDIDDPVMNETLADKPVESEERVYYDFGPTGPYSPLVYAPAAVGMYVGRSFEASIGTTINLAKLLQAAMYVVFCYGALWLLRYNKAKWLIFTVALLPASIFQASVITADTFTIGASLLFVATILVLLTQNKVMNQVQVSLLALSTVLLMFTKPSYALMAAMVLFLPSRIFKSRSHHIIVKSSVLVGAFLFLVAVSIKGAQYADTIITYREAAVTESISLLGQIGWILNQPFEFVAVLYHSVILYSQEWAQSLIGTLGYNSVPTPYILLLTSYITIVLSGLYVNDSSKRTALIMLGLGLLSSLAVIVLLYATFNEVGANSIVGVQGRYFIPCLPFIVLGAARLMPMKLSMSTRTAAPVFGVLTAVVLYGSVFAYLKSLF